MAHAYAKKMLLVVFILHTRGIYINIYIYI